jgi:hypothetical protein
LAANDMVAAYKNGGDWQSAMAKYDKVAVTPAKLDSFLNASNSGPDWKQVLVELIEVLEQSGDRLPLTVLNKKRTIEKLLNGKDRPPLDREPHAKSAESDHKSVKLDSDGDRCWAVTAQSEEDVLGNL